MAVLDRVCRCQPRARGGEKRRSADAVPVGTRIMDRPLNRVRTFERFSGESTKGEVPVPRAAVTRVAELLTDHLRASISR